MHKHSLTLSSSLPLLSLLALALSGCGGSRQTVASVSSPFTSDHQVAFDDALDMVRDPEALGGAWLRGWEEELEQRVALADVVALVHIQTIRNDLDLERRETYRLTASVDETYLGDNVGEELTLIVREGSPGYETVEDNDRRLLGQQFIVYLKWASESDGSVRARWHMSPASDSLATRTRSVLRRRRDVASEGGRRRVIVHRN